MASAASLSDLSKPKYPSLPSLEHSPVKSNPALKDGLREKDSPSLSSFHISTPYKQTGVYNLSKFQFAIDLINRFSLSVNREQCCFFGSRPAKLLTASSGIEYSPVDKAYKIACNLTFNVDEQCGDWRIAYHGTSIEGAFNIAKNGFDVTKTRQGKAYGPGVYVTPSWNMATQWTCDDVNDYEGTVYGAVLQCRVRTGSYVEKPLTWINPAVEVETDLSKTELVVQNPEDNIVVYGILLKPDPHKEWKELESSKKLSREDRNPKSSDDVA